LIFPQKQLLLVVNINCYLLKGFWGFGEQYVTEPSKHRHQNSYVLLAKNPKTPGMFAKYFDIIVKSITIDDRLIVKYNLQEVPQCKIRPHWFYKSIVGRIALIK